MGVSEVCGAARGYVEFVFQGVDMGRFTYLSWESVSCPPRCSRVLKEALVEPLAVLDRSLPRLPRRSEDHSSSSETAGGSVWFEDEDDELTFVAGALTPAEEQERIEASLEGCLMGADALAGFFCALVETLELAPFIEAVEEEARRAADRGCRVLLTLNPPPSLGQVPWELLPTGNTLENGEPERLLDIVDSASMAPLLRRDMDLSIPHPKWQEGPGLYLLRPWQTGKASSGGRKPHESVLARKSLAEWRRRIVALGDDSIGLVGESCTRKRLSEELSAEVRPTRFLYVGHVSGADAGAAMLLDDDASVFGLRKVDGHGYRWLCAEDLISGTLGAGEALSESNEGRSYVPFLLDFGVRSGFEDAPTIEEKSGPEIWPMPPRVGIVGCHSGSETSSHEPFGLSTACLEAGAELVFATRWTMYTDSFFKGCAKYLSEEGSTPLAAPAPEPFNELAIEVDALLRSAHPIVSMNEWKRNKLRAWRQDPHDLLASPITWAGLTVFRAPERVLHEPEPESSQPDHPNNSQDTPTERQTRPDKKTHTDPLPTKHPHQIQQTQGEENGHE